MKRKQLLLLLVTICTLLTSFKIIDKSMYPSYLQKKIDKILMKNFKNQDITTVQKFSPMLLKEEAFFQVINLNGELLGSYIIKLNNGCKLGGCMGIESYDQNETYESFYCMTIYSANGEIQQVNVLEYEGNYGYEITAKSWLKQFKAHKGGAFVLGENIDAISGATISANSMVNMINDQQQLIDSIQTLVYFKTED